MQTIRRPFCVRRENAWNIIDARNTLLSIPLNPTKRRCAHAMPGARAAPIPATASFAGARTARALRIMSVNRLKGLKNAKKNRSAAGKEGGAGFSDA